MSTTVKKIGIFELAFTDVKVKVNDEEIIYYDVLIHQTNNHFPFYVNLHKDKRFDFIEYTRPNKDTDKNEYNSYLSRKDMQMPLWLLNESNFKKVLLRCEELSQGEIK